MSQDHAIALGSARESFRRQFGVRLVTAAEEGTGLRHLPEGIYGFTGAPGTDELPLFSKPLYQGFEVHKWPAGVVAWIGYLTPAERAAFDQGQDPINVVLFPEPYGEATELVAIPAGRVDRRRPPTREKGNGMGMELGPRV